MKLNSNSSYREHRVGIRFQKESTRRGSGLFPAQHCRWDCRERDFHKGVPYIRKFQRFLSEWESLWMWGMNAGPSVSLVHIKWPLSRLGSLRTAAPGCYPSWTPNCKHFLQLASPEVPADTWEVCPPPSASTLITSDVILKPTSLTL